jgi:hypothetical protein
LFFSYSHIQGSLPNYFPVVPKGCESQSEALFKCIEGDASQKLRQLEQTQQSSSTVANAKPSSNSSSQEQGATEEATATSTGDDNNPLGLCRDLIAQYQKCCDKQLKKKTNWMLTETYRVQEEYRYQGSNDDVKGKENK